MKKDRWLLLIHQIPPKPDALRVKVWRRLQQIGAVAIKPSVYAMPCDEQFKEDFNWILKEITGGGGDGSIMEAQFIQGLNNDRIAALFQNARKADYEKIIAQANEILANASSGKGDKMKDESARIAKMQGRLKEIISIDFFKAPERGTAELLLNEISNRLTDKKPVNDRKPYKADDFNGKTWVTRSSIFIDRIACGWLIRRFIDKNATFKFVKPPEYKPLKEEIQYDMYEGKFTHEGDKCSFEVMIEKFQFQDKALFSLAQVVHDIDLKEVKYGRGETMGFKALLTGLAQTRKDDDKRMSDGMAMFDCLYDYFRRSLN